MYDRPGMVDSSAVDDGVDPVNPHLKHEPRVALLETPSAATTNRRPASVSAINGANPLDFTNHNIHVLPADR